MAGNKRRGPDTLYWCPKCKYKWQKTWKNGKRIEAHRKVYKYWGKYGHEDGAVEEVCFECKAS